MFGILGISLGLGGGGAFSEQSLRPSGGIELRQTSGGWVQPIPMLSLGWVLEDSRAMLEVESAVMLPWVERQPGLRIMHGSARCSILVGMELPSAPLELGIGPVMYIDSSRWTAPIEAGTSSISPGVRTRMLLGAATSDWRLGLGASWMWDDLHLTIQVGRWP